MNLTITEHPEHEYRYKIRVGGGGNSYVKEADQVSSWLCQEYNNEKWVRTEVARFVLVEHWLVMAIKMRFG